MTRRTVIVSRTGTVFRTREADVNSKHTPRGETGETEGVIRALMDRGDVDVVYFGRVQGNAPCPVVDPMITDVVLDTSKGNVQLNTAAYQQSTFEENMRRLSTVCEPESVLCVVNLASASAWSLIGNPGYTDPRCSEALYTAPTMALIRDLDVPRFAVITDVRNHPRNPEMTYLPRIAPAAMLGQLQRETTRTIQRVRFRTREVWAAAETWGWLPERPNTGEVPCVIMGHPHVDDGTRKGDWSVWESLLPPDDDWPDWLEIFGAGWENCPREQARLRARLVDPESVLDYTARAVCAPLVAHSPGWLGTKANVLLSCGVVPLPYGRGENERRWDPAGYYLPKDSVLRIETWEDVQKWCERLRDDERFRELGLRSWRERMSPNFRRLNRLIDDALVGRDMTTDEWFLDYGGYRRCG